MAILLLSFSIATTESNFVQPPKVVFQQQVLKTIHNNLLSFNYKNEDVVITEEEDKTELCGGVLPAFGTVGHNLSVSDHITH